MKRHPENNFRRYFFTQRTQSFHVPYGVLSHTVRSSLAHRTEFSCTPYGTRKDCVRCAEGLRTVRAILFMWFVDSKNDRF
ncbi:MAG: hypothetical protein RR346_12270 [Bacteroidales bacterium]